MCVLKLASAEGKFPGDQENVGIHRRFHHCGAKLLPGLIPFRFSRQEFCPAQRFAGGKTLIEASENIAGGYGVVEPARLERGDATARTAELSGGMQKRVALARAIAAQPDIMFFDEPTTGLDPIMGAVIDGLIVDCVRRLGSTAIAITHDMASARRIGDVIAMLHRGRIIWSGPPSALMDSGNPEVDQFTHGRREGPIQMELRR